MSNKLRKADCHTRRVKRHEAKRQAKAKQARAYKSTKPGRGMHGIPNNWKYTSNPLSMQVMISDLLRLQFRQMRRAA